MCMIIIIVIIFINWERLRKCLILKYEKEVKMYLCYLYLYMFWHNINIGLIRKLRIEFVIGKWNTYRKIK
jgi:hypothetical protein